MRRCIAAFAVLGAVVLAGCGNGASGISGDNVNNLVLKPAELPNGFSSFAEGPTSSLDVQGTPRANLSRFGRKAGWVQRMRSGHADGLLLVVSTADVFGDADGAHSDLTAYDQGFAQQASDGLAKRVPVPQVGDGAIGAKLVAPGGERSFAVAWRFRNATASVVAIGHGIALRDVIALARKQQRKLN